MLTADAIAAARQTWERADLRDYNLEWTTSGTMSGHYRVAVRGGKVEGIESILPDGRTVEAHPGQPDLYGVDGLFVILEEELAQLQSDTPFGQPRGTTAVLRFTPDPKLGYPRSYYRDVVGVPKGLALEVVRLDTFDVIRPVPTTAPPPPLGGPQPPDQNRD